MNKSDSTDAPVAATPRSDVFEAPHGFEDISSTKRPRGNDGTFARKYLLCWSELHNINAVNDTVFSPVPTTSMGTFTNYT